MSRGKRGQALELVCRVSLLIGSLTGIAASVLSFRARGWKLGPSEVVGFAASLAGLFAACVLLEFLNDLQEWMRDRGRQAHRAIAVVLALVSSILASVGVAQRWSWWFWGSAIAWLLLIWWWADRWIEREVTEQEGAEAKRQDMCALLEIVAKEIEREYVGTLPSVNIMVPFSETELEVHSCTSDMDWSGRAGLTWEKGKGCVGRLWETAKDTACAVLRTPGDHARFGLDEATIALHEDVTCVLSVAIRRGMGREQELLGFLNIHSSSSRAPDVWTVPRYGAGEVEADLTTEMKSFLIATVKWVADELAA